MNRRFRYDLNLSEHMVELLNTAYNFGYSKGAGEEGPICSMKARWSPYKNDGPTFTLFDESSCFPLDIDDMEVGECYWVENSAVSGWDTWFRLDRENDGLVLNTCVDFETVKDLPVQIKIEYIDLFDIYKTPPGGTKQSVNENLQIDHTCPQIPVKETKVREFYWLEGGSLESGWYLREESFNIWFDNIDMNAFYLSEGDLRTLRVYETGPNWLPYGYEAKTQRKEVTFEDLKDGQMYFVQQVNKSGVWCRAIVWFGNPKLISKGGYVYEEDVPFDESIRVYETDPVGEMYYFSKYGKT